MSLHLTRLKDNKRRFVYKKREKNYIALDWALNVINSRRSILNVDKTTIYNMNKFIYKRKTYSIKPNQSQTRIRNFCLNCGKQRASSQFFRRARWSLLEELKTTQKFPGVTRKLNSK